jgi:hypothetical protein
MAHAHHHHQDPASYYTEQLCTIAFCGGFGGIAVAVYATGTVNYILKAGLLQYSLLAGGIVLLALVLIRAVALWLTVGNPEAACGRDHGEGCCDNDHEHELAVTTAAEGLALVTEPVHDHGHDHSHGHGHSHAHGDGHSHGGHDHDHGWAPVRYIVLLVPILLYFFVPIERLRAGQGDEFKGKIDQAWARQINSTGSLGELDFKELVGAAQDLARRKWYEGKTATISGELVPSSNNDKMFSLVRFRIRCCSSDKVSLPVPILVDDSLTKEVPEAQRMADLQAVQALRSECVQVTCQIQFHKHQDMPNLWIAVLVVRPTKDKPLTELIEQAPGKCGYI